MSNPPFCSKNFSLSLFILLLLNAQHDNQMPTIRKNKDPNAQPIMFMVGVMCGIMALVLYIYIYKYIRVRVQESREEDIKN